MAAGLAVRDQASGSSLRFPAPGRVRSDLAVDELNVRLEIDVT